MKYLRVYEEYDGCNDQWEEFLTFVNSLELQGDEEDLRKLFIDLCNSTELGNDEKGVLLASKLKRWGMHLNDRVALMGKVADMQI